MLLILVGARGGSPVWFPFRMRQLDGLNDANKSSWQFMINQLCWSLGDCVLECGRQEREVNLAIQIRDVQFLC